MCELFAISTRPPAPGTFSLPPLARRRGRPPPPHGCGAPKATKPERKGVKEVPQAGEDPAGPRHGPGVRLVRAGKNFVCNSCGVAYARM